MTSISDEAKEYSKSLLTIGNLAIIVWIMLGAVAIGFFSFILGWLFLILAFASVFLILHRLGCSSCYYCKSCTRGFGKIADLFFADGYMAGVNSSLTLKIIFVYILLGAIPIAFIIISYCKSLPSKIAVLVLLLYFYSIAVADESLSRDFVSCFSLVKI